MPSYTPRQIDIIDNLNTMLDTSPWVIRIGEYNGSAVLTVMERISGELMAHGSMTYYKARYCLDAIRTMLSIEIDTLGRPAKCQELLDDAISYRGDIPLCEEVGGKLALLFILCPKGHDSQRIELLAWRIEKFTREEALYWLGRIMIPCYSTKSLSWSRDGLRTMLCGRGKGDEEVVNEMLETLRK